MPGDRPVQVVGMHEHGAAIGHAVVYAGLPVDGLHACTREVDIGRELVEQESAGGLEDACGAGDRGVPFLHAAGVVNHAERDDEIEGRVVEARQVIHGPDADAVDGFGVPEYGGHALTCALHHGRRGVDGVDIEPALGEEEGVAPAGTAEVEHADAFRAAVLRDQPHEAMIGIACGEHLDNVRLFPEPVGHGNRLIRSYREWPEVARAGPGAGSPVVPRGVPLRMLDSGSAARPVTGRLPHAPFLEEAVMRSLHYMVAASVVLSAGCDRPERAGMPASEPVDEAAVAGVGATAAQQLRETLVKRLTAAIDSGGTASAIDVCALEAGALTDSISAGLGAGIAMKRTSTRVRNTSNAPDALEQAALAYFQSVADSAGDLPASWVQAAGAEGHRYYEPLRVVQLCVQCHGPVDSIAPDVRAVIAERYPDDRATGYVPGDFRGLIRVSVPAGSAGDGM